MRAFAVDAAGDVYLGGFFSGTMDFDAGADVVPVAASVKTNLGRGGTGEE